MKGSGFCVLRVVAIVVAVFGIATCFAQVAKADDGKRRQFVEGSPPVHIVIVDLYKTSDSTGDFNVPVLMNRRMITYDREGRKVCRQRILDPWTTVYEEFNRYDDNGNRTFGIFSSESSNAQMDYIDFVTTQFDEQNRITAEMVYAYDAETGALKFASALRWTFIEYDGSFLNILKDSDGRFLKRVEGTLNADGKPAESTTTEFEFDGSVEGITTEQFDDDGNCISKIGTDANGKVTFEVSSEFDSFGRNIKSTSTSYRNGVHTRVITTEYSDRSMRILESEDGAEPFERQVEKYNELGEIVLSSNILDPRDVRRTWEEYIYETRDEFGNWTKRTCLSHWKTADGQVVRTSVDLRTIIYYPELAEAAVANSTEIEGDEG
jgi:hypothetical protein